MHTYIKLKSHYTEGDDCSWYKQEVIYNLFFLRRILLTRFLPSSLFHQLILCSPAVENVEGEVNSHSVCACVIYPILYRIRDILHASNPIKIVIWLLIIRRIFLVLLTVYTIALLDPKPKVHRVIQYRLHCVTITSRSNN